MKKTKLIAIICLLLAIFMLTACFKSDYHLTPAQAQTIHTLRMIGGADIKMFRDTWSIEYKGLDEEGLRDYHVKLDVTYVEPARERNSYTYKFKISNIVLEGNYEDEYLAVVNTRIESLRLNNISTSNGMLYYPGDYTIETLKNPQVNIMYIPLSTLEEGMEINFHMVINGNRLPYGVVDICSRVDTKIESCVMFIGIEDI